MLPWHAMLHRHKSKRTQGTIANIAYCNANNGACFELQAVTYNATSLHELPGRPRPKCTEIK